MSNIMQTSGANLPVKEVQGKRVVTYKQIAELHQVPIVNLRNNFMRNQKRFIEGTDFFKFKEQSSESNNLLLSRLYFTESGYLMLVKSLTDDLSWEVQRMLVNSYFRTSVWAQMLTYLPEQTKKVMYYRGLGLTQVETAKVMDISAGTVKGIENRLKSMGYVPPNQNGMRSWGMYQSPDERISKTGTKLRVAKRTAYKEQMEVEL